MDIEYDKVSSSEDIEVETIKSTKASSNSTTRSKHQAKRSHGKTATDVKSLLTTGLVVAALSVASSGLGWNALEDTSFHPYDNGSADNC